jgi:TDG/mug DNA glycosylase family protein
VHQPTLDVYADAAATYAHRRGVQHPERAEAFAASVGGGRRLDLGCGPGQYLPLLGEPVVAADASPAMLAEVARHHPTVPAVRAELRHLPWGPRTFRGVWASKAHQHLTAADLPAALAEVHRVLQTGGRFDLTVFATAAGRATTEEVTGPSSGDDLPGRWFTWWEPEHLARVIDAAGFEVDDLAVRPAPPGSAHARIEVRATALRALPDHVGAGMRLLCCGLNPSLHAADAGVGYVTGSNRFWRALAGAGLTTVDRDPRRLLEHHRIGMTDLVKRPTARADEVAPAEFRAGIERLHQLCSWLEPEAVAIVGLAGWRAGVDRRATVGWQPQRLGPSPVYVLPSTSGLNAGTSLDDLVAHLRAAAGGPRVG